ncbi:MAG: hypothetical protein R3E66_04085 [bacterium]
MKTLLVLTILSLSSVAFAQDKAYSPKAADWSSLLKPANYSESPLKLEFPELERRRVVNGSRVDFEHVYDVEYTELILYLESAYKEQRPVAAFRPGAIPYANVREALVLGTQSGSVVKYTIGAVDLPIRFQIELRPDREHTIVTFQNTVFSQLYSGVMPARVGYKPKDSTKQIPFRWN